MKIKNFLSICLIGIIIIVIIYILRLYNSYDYLSFISGVATGGFSVLLGYLINN